AAASDHRGRWEWRSSWLARKVEAEPVVVQEVEALRPKNVTGGRISDVRRVSGTGNHDELCVATILALKLLGITEGRDRVLIAPKLEHRRPPVDGVEDGEEEPRERRAG